jgi:DNA repair protein RadC
VSADPLPPSILERPPFERPRERLLLAGEEELSDEELLALLLGPAGGRPARQVAARCLEAFPGLRALQQADPLELVRDGGLGVAAACAVRAAFALARRAARAGLDPGQRIRGGADLFERYRARLAGARKETFLALYLDGRNRAIREERVSEGTLTAAIVHPREVFGPALRAGAASVLVVHNHPSGDPAPSPEDLEVTERLRQSGELVGIPLLDHLVVGEDRYCSFLERGLLRGPTA